MKNVLGKIDKFEFLCDIVVTDMPENLGEMIILGRPFLETIHAQIDVYLEKISLWIGEDRIKFDNAGSTSNQNIPNNDPTPFSLEHSDLGEIANISESPNFDVEEEYAKEIGNPYSQRFDEYKQVFDNEVEQLSNEYTLRIGKRDMSWMMFWRNASNTIEKLSIIGTMKDSKKMSNGEVEMKKLNMNHLLPHSDNSTSTILQQFPGANKSSIARRIPPEVQGRTNLSYLLFEEDGYEIWVPDAPASKKPIIVLMYHSLEHAYEYYKAYTKKVSFDVRLGTNPASKAGASTFNNWKVSSSGTDCKAVFCDVVFMKSSCEVTYTQQVFLYQVSHVNLGLVKSFHLMRQIYGDYDFIGTISVDFRNFRRDVLEFISKDDAQMIVEMLMNKKDFLPNFSFQYETGENNALTNLFSVDEYAKRNYYVFCA
ncbi:hypothetical protein Tco_0922320 [Tanacetum coccineum]|uniref:Reverse transcriptase domain-containing protein n=1 Tax=Tanacetum coccineum TaxID=301880 RepID=A0ABQ5CXW4_9ASTR